MKQDPKSENRSLRAPGQQIYEPPHGTMFTTRIASALSPALRREVKNFYRKMLRMARSLPETGAAAHYEEHFKPVKICSIALHSYRQ